MIPGTELITTGHEALMSGPGSAKGQLQRACLAVLLQMESDGLLDKDDDDLSTTDRFVYYALKQLGYPLKKHASRKDDQDVIDAVKELRDRGVIPYGWISDETRSVEWPHVARSVRQCLLDWLDQARINAWDGQPRPMIICETRGVRAVLRATARRYGARITSTNGQAGGYLHTDVAPLLRRGTPGRRLTCAGSSCCGASVFHLSTVSPAWRPRRRTERPDMTRAGPAGIAIVTCSRGMLTAVTTCPGRAARS